MRTTLLAVVAALLVTVQAPRPAAALDVGELKVATWNIWHTEEGDRPGFRGIGDRGWPTWEERIDHGVDVMLARLQPHVIGLQEVMAEVNGTCPEGNTTFQNEQIDRLLRRLRLSTGNPEYRLAWFVREGSSPREGAINIFCWERQMNVLIYDATVLLPCARRVSRRNESQFGAPPDGLSPVGGAEFAVRSDEGTRIAGMRFELLEHPGVFVDIYNVHLPTGSGGGRLFRDLDYLVECERLYDVSYPEPTLPPIVLGDFNAYAASVERVTYLARISGSWVEGVLPAIGTYLAANPDQSPYLPDPLSGEIDMIRLGRAAWFNPRTNVGAYEMLDYYNEEDRSRFIEPVAQRLHSDHALVFKRIRYWIR